MVDLKSFFQNKRNVTSLVVLLILVLAIPLGIYLARNTQIFAPKADVTGSIALAEGPCVTTINGEKVLICKDVPLRLISPFDEPSSTPSASLLVSLPPSTAPSVSPTISPVPSASSATPPASVTPSRTPAASVPSGPTLLITITNDFSPRKPRITKGTSVTWKNNSNASITLTPKQDLFPPKLLSPGQDFSFTFTKTGNYKIREDRMRIDNNIQVRN